MQEKFAYVKKKLYFCIVNLISLGMKKLKNNFTTLEQSKMLLVLGVPANSADCRYELAIHDGGIGQVFCVLGGVIHSNDIPCWSVGRLMEIIKICSDLPIDWAGGLNEEREILEVVDSTLYALCLGNHMDFSKLDD